MIALGELILEILGQDAIRSVVVYTCFISPVVGELKSPDQCGFFHLCSICTVQAHSTHYSLPYILWLFVCLDQSCKFLNYHRTLYRIFSEISIYIQSLQLYQIAYIALKKGTPFHIEICESWYRSYLFTQFSPLDPSCQPEQDLHTMSV